MSKRIALVLLAVAFGACQTITEVMPTPPETPSPTPTKSPKPPDATPTAQPTKPTPTPTREPTEEPTTNTGCGPGGYPPSCDPVASISMGVYWVSYNGKFEMYGDPDYRTSAPVTAIVQLDSTPKDAKNKHTQPKGVATWRHWGSGYKWTDNLKNPNMPQIQGIGVGILNCVVTIDGVDSPALSYTFY